MAIYSNQALFRFIRSCIVRYECWQRPSLHVLDALSYHLALSPGCSRNVRLLLEAKRFGCLGRNLTYLVQHALRCVMSTWESELPAQGYHDID